MNDPKAFINIERRDPGCRPKDQRILDFDEVEKSLGPKTVREQAARCMDCGVPFCHGCGCPLGNLIPEWNALTAQGHYREALEILLSSSNFPEFTARICPALCEAACTNALDGKGVSIRQIEKFLVEKGFEEGWIQAFIPQNPSGKHVAVIGSGPAGLALADNLRKMGHEVTVYERDRYCGGLLRYGIPDFKLSKQIVERRIKLMCDSGITFETNTEIGRDITANFLIKRYDALAIAIGARKPRDLNIPERELKNIHFAMDFLKQQNQLVGGEKICNELIDASGKNVVVIGGGDTGSDCVGTAIRQGAAKVTQLEIMPQPPARRDDSTPWPQWPYLLRTSSSHQEGCERQWNVITGEFTGQKNVESIKCAKVKWHSENGRFTKFEKIEGSEFEIKTDLVLLALGFTGADATEIIEQLGLKLDSKDCIVCNKQNTQKGIFVCGDAATGASLVVRAIAAGKELATQINEYLKK